eukprot:TRINITY_DN12240_c0_g1_i1.p1 TRINITY_DN12240_c0_g1~~TRINITY_DN12240_c0_g1_i1.p1  ORF type:complete len:968 (+),score=416.95 TRINITY_DN12240_c0_g1_i1:66-2969(+)
MDITMAMCLHDPPEPIGGTAVQASDQEGRVTFTAPPELVQAGFPHAEQRFGYDHVHMNPDAQTLYDSHLQGVGAALLDRQNAVLYHGGKRGTPKRHVLFGAPGQASSGLLHRLLKDLGGHADFTAHRYIVSCFTMGLGKEILDMFDLENTKGSMTDSLKGPPVISGVSEIECKTLPDLHKLAERVNENYAVSFKEVTSLPGADEPFPAYNPGNLLFQLRIHPLDAKPRETEDGYEMLSDVEQGSLTLVALGDSERPVLCGIEKSSLTYYEESQKTLSAVVGVLGAIRCKRLRVPFGKCKLMHLLKRAYNSEKNNPYNDENKPTFTLICASVLTDGRNAEESFHSLVFGKRIINVIGGSGVGPASRDLAVERWRLEQDIVELKDELEIVRTVHGYKPCIYNQAKPVQNIREEENRRVNKILNQRKEAAEREMENMRARAQQQAQAHIDEEQKKSNTNIAKLESLLAKKTEQNQHLTAQRDSKIKEYERQLEKVRKKRVDEEEKTEKYRKEIADIGQELAARQESIAKQKAQLELLSQDHMKGKEMLMKARQEAKAKREKVVAERLASRQKWASEIQTANKKVLDSVIELDKLKKNRKSLPNQGSYNDDDDDTEAGMREDIKSIDRLLHQMINIDTPPTRDEKTDNLRKQLQNYFDTERKRCEQKLALEQKKRDELEKAAANYKGKISEQHSKIRKDQMADAVKKEKHLESLLEQVVQYLEHGCRMTKIRGTERRRFLFISEDRRKILSCELDTDGQPVNKKRPTTTAYFKDIRKIILGQHTPNFLSFEAQKRPGTGSTINDLIHDVEGTYNRTPTTTVSPENIKTYFYRSFSLEFKKGKTWDVIAETDNDFEAWVVVLQRFMCDKVNWERLQDRRGGNEPPPTLAWGSRLDLATRQGADRLMPEEERLCSENHITPIQYINIKSQIIHKSQLGVVTVYDVRTLSTLDLLRSRVVYDFFVAKKVIPNPN